MWKTVNSFSIVLFSGVLANRSILLASSIFLRSKVKKALPDLLIFIINKNLLFSIHYRHDSALGTNLDLGSWVQSIMELRRVFYDSILVFCLFYFHMSWRYSCMRHTLVTFPLTGEMLCIMINVGAWISQTTWFGFSGASPACCTSRIQARDERVREGQRKVLQAHVLKRPIFFSKFSSGTVFYLFPLWIVKYWIINKRINCEIHSPTFYRWALWGNDTPLS